jgi:hypothetical protein
MILSLFDAIPWWWWVSLVLVTAWLGSDRQVGYLLAGFIYTLVSAIPFGMNQV